MNQLPPHRLMLIPLFLTLSFTTASQPALSADGPLCELQFDEPGGLIAVDTSGTGNHADIWGAKWATGPFGSALHFSGTESYVSIPPLEGLDASDQLTVEAWVLWKSGGRYPNIITGGRWSPGGFLVFVSDRNCHFRMGHPGASATGSPQQWKEVGVPLVSNFELGKWYHLAATFDRPQITTYLNGEKVASAQWDYPVGYAGETIIGRWHDTQNCHHGLIDDVRISDRALTADEIHASYAASAPRRRTPLEAGAKPYEILPDDQQRGQAAVTLDTKTFSLEIDQRGNCLALIDEATGENYISRPAPICIAKIAGRDVRPIACSHEDGKLTFQFARSDVEATIAAIPHSRRITFEVVSAEGDDLEQLSFVHIKPDAAGYRHRTSGLVASDDFAICLRALNLQSDVRIGWGASAMSATAYAQYGIEGARAALVAAPRDEIRAALQQLVRAEDLPKSQLGGPWALDAPENRGSYLFAAVSEANVDRWIDLALRGGFKYIHFIGWWQSLGHYQPREALFPNGLQGMKQTVQKIHDAGLKAGMHTLSGCIATNDSWVTPVPDPRLAADATYTLAEDMDEAADTIRTVQQPGQHDTVWAYASRGNVIRIGTELVQYSAISREQPYAFLKCTRGAFGTKASPHEAGEKADHLRTIYNSFYPDENSTLVGEVADRIANVYNTCKMDQIYMDGAEGMGSWHAIAKMRQAIYDRLQRPALVEASAWGHWSWYFHSRIGAWDHPKWGLKQFVDMHCADIPQYRNAALLEAQLGWWAVLGPTDYSRAEMPDEMEYFAYKTFANDAPISIQGVGAASRPANARMREYLTTLGRYQRLRLANYFSDDVKQRLREPGQEFHLRQAEDGNWQFLPTDYLSHRVTGSSNGANSWTVNNRFHAQQPGLRIEALYSAEPYDSDNGLQIAAPSPEDFTVHRDAQGVTHNLDRSTDRVKVGDASLHLTATNTTNSSRGAWALASKRYDPHFDMKQCRALGVWIHGDGKGELLNIQLSHPREYNRAYSEHYVDIDFEGWRYFEILLRERDAHRYRDYQWPYGGHYYIFRNPLNRDHVSDLNLYLNDLPPGETVDIYLSAIHALPTGSAQLQNPTLDIAGKEFTIPVAINSASYIEVDPGGEWRQYDRRCALLERGQLPEPVPMLQSGPQPIEFTCNAAQPLTPRANVTFITRGEPFGERRPDDEIDWTALRYEYEPPRLITSLDGDQNRWTVPCRQQSDGADLNFELTVEQTGGRPDAYTSPDAVTIESFDDLGFFAESADNRFTKYVYDGENRGVSNKPGVTHEIARSTDVAKVGDSSLRYTAESTRDDNAGWSARGRRFAKYLDLSRYSGIGFWLHGDGNGEFFKLQLRDDEGAWHDMVTRVDFTNWRYCDFDLAGANLDLSRIEYLIMYYNAIPAGKTVTCYIDDIRAVTQTAALHNPQMTVNGEKILFPVELSPDDRLVFKGMGDCTVFTKAPARAEPIQPEGKPPTLRPGANHIVFSLGQQSPTPFRAVLTPVKNYR